MQDTRGFSRWRCLKQRYLKLQIRWSVQYKCNGWKMKEICKSGNKRFCSMLFRKLVWIYRHRSWSWLMQTNWKWCCLVLHLHKETLTQKSLEMLAPDREEQRKRDKKVSTKKHRNTLRDFLVLSNFASCLGNLALFCTTTSRAVIPYQSKVQRHHGLPTSSHHFLFKKQDKYLASSCISWPLFVRGFPWFFTIPQGWTPPVAERGASGRVAAWRSGQERRSQGAPSAAVWGPLWVGSSCCEALAEASWKGFWKWK